MQPGSLCRRLSTLSPFAGSAVSGLLVQLLASGSPKCLYFFHLADASAAVEMNSAKSPIAVLLWKDLHCPLPITVENKTQSQLKVTHNLGTIHTGTVQVKALYVQCWV